jgi:hemerythrin-like domain-containing protein
VLNRLSLEHRLLLEKLDLLESQYLDMCRSKTPDYSLMRSIVVYIQEYPEQVHHPLEDMIYASFLERADDAAFVHKLISEHTQMEVVTLEIRELLEAMPGCAASGRKLKQRLSDYLVWQRRHIYSEESEVFPLMEKSLTEKDWERLQYMLPILDDPVRGGRTWYDYERLSREIEGKHRMQLTANQNGGLNLTGTERTQAV